MKTVARKIKMKTHRGASKRLKVTGTGKIKHYHSGHNHRLEVKTAKARRRLRKSSVITSVHEKAVRQLIPYK